MTYSTHLLQYPAPTYANEWASPIYKQVMTYNIDGFLMTEEVRHLPSQGGASDPLPSGSTATLPIQSERRFKVAQVKLPCN